MSHRLDPLLQPRTIALVGATTRENAPGRDMLLTLKRGGFAGQAWAINPKYAEVEGFPCLPSIAAIGQPVDLAILSVANAGLERALTDAAKAGTRAAVIFASATVPEDPKLAERLAAIAREAAMPLCGVNCMGFYNDEAGVWACGFPSKRQRDPGHIAFIAQSGSIFGCIAHNDPRYRINLAVSPGSETVTTAADYIDYALSRPSTRVIGLFLESVRDPENFIAALARAERQRVPVVVLKVGRSEVSRRLALSHTGALTGDDAAFDALCRRHGVLRVRSIDELAATLLLLSADRRLGQGGLATIHDSGGERELLADLALDQGVPFAQIGEATTRRLDELLEPGLEPANPLDAWGTGVNFVENFSDLLTTLAQDPDTAIAALFTDARDHSYVHDGFVESALRAAKRTDKPVAIVVNFSGVKHDGQVLRAKEAGVPLLDGTVPALQALRHALDFRDHRPAPPAPALPPLSAAWRRRLAEPRVLSEAESLALLADFGLPVARSLPATSAAEALAAFRSLGGAVAMKAAAEGLLHKSDAGGVRLDLRDEAAVAAAWGDLSARLGPKVILQAMAPAGAEFILGARFDPQFGPLVVLGAGGILVELLADSACSLAPLDPASAERMIDGLKAAKLLGGLRGRPALDRAALAATLLRFSQMVAALGPLAAEIDVNPLIVHPAGAVAVDALVVPATARG